MNSFINAFKMTYKFNTSFAAALACIALLQACGGGGDSGGPSAANFVEEEMPLANAALSFSGTAATGAPIANAVVSARCTDGTRFTATTNAQGQFTIAPAAAASLPCMVSVTAGGQNLYSIATATGPLNITPLTSAVVHAVSGLSSPFTRFNSSSPSTFRAGLTPASIAQAKQVVTTMLSSEYGFSVPTGKDFLTSAFTANSIDPLDKLLDDIKAADTVRSAATPPKPSMSALISSLSNNLISTSDGRFTTIFGKNEIEDQTSRTGNFARRPTGVKIEMLSINTGECSAALVIAGQRVALANGNATSYFALPALVQGPTNVEAYVNGTTNGLPMAEGVRRQCGTDFTLFDNQGEIRVSLGGNSTTGLRSFMNGSRAVQTKTRYSFSAQ